MYESSNCFILSLLSPHPLESIHTLICPSPSLPLFVGLLLFLYLSSVGCSYYHHYHHYRCCRCSRVKWKKKVPPFTVTGHVGGGGEGQTGIYPVMLGREAKSSRWRHSYPRLIGLALAYSRAGAQMPILFDDAVFCKKRSTLTSPHIPPTLPPPLTTLSSPSQRLHK